MKRNDLDAILVLLDLFFAKMLIIASCVLHFGEQQYSPWKQFILVYFPNPFHTFTYSHSKEQLKKKIVFFKSHILYQWYHHERQHIAISITVKLLKIHEINTLTILGYFAINTPRQFIYIAKNLSWNFQFLMGIIFPFTSCSYMIVCYIIVTTS